jgi:hypothetical protein
LGLSRLPRDAVTSATSRPPGPNALQSKVTRDVTSTVVMHNVGWHPEASYPFVDDVVIRGDRVHLHYRVRGEA